MNVSADTFIAGSLTADDWDARKVVLATGSASDWESAFKDFFLQRLELRYLGPIKVLQKNGKYLGEGFSIVAIQCSLVEFLESSFQGKNYRHQLRGQLLGAHEYSASKDIFVSFLTNRSPFSSFFANTSAHDFYVSVRCGLLHEARTKNGWKIWGRDHSGKIADTASRVLYRDNFQDGLWSYIRQYGQDLQTDKALQEAFVRKLDGLFV